MWWIFALLAAFFASLTAIFSKIGVTGVDSEVATAIRTVVILILAGAIVISKGSMDSILSLSQKNLFYLIISGITTGLSWLFYFKALQVGKLSDVAPVDKLSLA